MGVAAGDDQGEGGVGVKDGLRFVVSHPFRKRTRKGWGTQLKNRSRSFDSLRSLRMTALLGLGSCLAFVEEDGVDVAFQMVDGDEGKVVGEGEGFGVGDADEEGSSKARTAGDGNGVEAGKGDAGIRQRGADDGNDGAEMLAGGQFWNDSAITGVGGDLGGNDGAEGASTALDDGGGGLVAGRFDGED